MIGPPAKIAEHYGVEVSNPAGDLPLWVAIPAFYPAVDGSATWIPVGGPYELTIVVTGANFDAVTFRGQFTMSKRVSDEGKDLMWCRWEQAPIELARPK